MSRLTTRVVVSESARETAQSNWDAATTSCCGTASRSTASRRATPTPSTVPAVFFVGRHEPRKGLARAARRVAADSTATRCCGSAATGPQTEELRSARSPNVEWLGSDHRRASANARLRGATVFCAPSLQRRVVRRRAARGDGRRTRRSSRPRSRATRTSPAPTAKRCSSRPATSTTLRDALRACSTTPALRERLVAAGRARAAEFSMARLAERYLELYERALVPRRERDRSERSTPRSSELALDDCRARVRRRRRAVARRPGAHANGVGVAPGGDVTMAIDEIAEHVLERCSPKPATSRSTPRTAATWSSAGPRAILVVDPIDGTRPAAAGLESCCVSVAVVPPRHATRRSATCSSASCTRSRAASASTRRRGDGARAERADGSPMPLRSSANTDLARAVLDRRVARPARAAGVDRCSKTLIDGSSMRGGYFDLGSATFNMTRIVTGQLDAYVDIGRRLVDELPELEAAVPRGRATGAVCTNFPYDVAAAGADRHGGRRRRDRGRRRSARRPPGGRLRRRLRPRGAGQRVSGPARRSCWSRSTAAWIAPARLRRAT